MVMLDDRIRNTTRNALKTTTTTTTTKITTTTSLICYILPRVFLVTKVAKFLFATSTDSNGSVYDPKVQFKIR